MNTIKLLFVLLLGVFAIGFSSCDDDDDEPYAVIYFVNALSTKYENPSLNNRPEEGILRFTLWSDNTLSYSIYVYNIQSTDELTGAALYAGDVLTNGSFIVDLKPTFSEGVAKGNIAIRESLADSLRDLRNQIYINIPSTQVQSGLVRGQINTDIIYTSTIALSGTNEVPPVTTATTGSAVVRMTTEGGMGYKIYYTVASANIPAGDEFSSAGIYNGAQGVVDTDPAYIELCSSSQQLNTKQMKIISQPDAYNLYYNDSYLNVLTTAYPNGLIRGQLKNDYENPVTGTVR